MITGQSKTTLLLRKDQAWMASESSHLAVKFDVRDPTDDFRVVKLSLYDQGSFRNNPLLLQR